MSPGGQVSKKISEIQNAGLGEHRLRDLNDEINKLLREKGHWETQVRRARTPRESAANGSFQLVKQGRILPIELHVKGWLGFLDMKHVHQGAQPSLCLKIAIGSVTNSESE